MKKSTVFLIVILCVPMGFGSTDLYAEAPIRTTLNGKEIVFDQPPVIEEGRTLVPARAILEALGLQLDFDEETRKVTAKNEEIIIEMTLDSNRVLLNGEYQDIDVPAKILGGRTMVPIRFIAQNMGLVVIWSEKDRIITLQSENEVIVSEIEEETKNDTPQKTNTTQISTKETFDKENYLNFSEILNFVKFSNISNNNTVLLTDRKDLLEYKVKSTFTTSEILDKYFVALEEKGFIRIKDKSEEAYYCLDYVKGNMQVRFDLTPGETHTKITVTRKDADIAVPFFAMRDSEIKKAIEDSQKGLDYYVDEILPKYTVKSKFSTSIKDEFLISTPYLDIVRNRFGGYFKVNNVTRQYSSVLRAYSEYSDWVYVFETNNNINTDTYFKAMKNKYINKFDYGNKVYIYTTMYSDYISDIKQGKEKINYYITELEKPRLDIYTPLNSILRAEKNNELRFPASIAYQDKSDTFAYHSNSYNGLAPIDGTSITYPTITNLFFTSVIELSLNDFDPKKPFEITTNYSDDDEDEVVYSIDLNNYK